MPAAKTVPVIRGVHHTAFRCRDAAETQRFYEGVLGLPLAAALSFDEEPGTGAPLKYMHLFFEMGDGNYVAFFDLPDSADESRFKKKSGFNLHIAFEVATKADLDDFQRRFQEHGYRLTQLQGIDMFPHTEHIEAVSLFTRQSGRPS